MQKALIAMLIFLNFTVPAMRLAIQAYEKFYSLPLDNSSFIFHSFIVPFQLLVIVAFFKGLIPQRTIGIFVSEIACFAFLTLGNFVEPHLNVIFEMGSLYITFFVQAPLIDNNKARFFVHIKPLVTVVGCGFASGALYIKALDEGIILLCIFTYGVIGVWSSMSVEQIKDDLVKSLEETKMQLMTVLSAVPVGILVITPGKVELTNDTCLKLLDCETTSEVLDRVSDLQRQPEPESPSRSIKEDLLNYYNSPSTQQADFGQTLFKDKALHWIGQKTTWNSKPAVVVVMKDVSSVLKLERSQNESRFKNVLLRSVSHELKTPTNAIIHSLQSLAQDQQVSQETKDKLDVAEVSCKHLLLLIGDLLDFSQLVSGKFSLRPTSFNLREALRESVELMRLIAHKKEVTISTLVDPMLPKEVYSDKVRFSQVLLNLLSNAVKFTNKKGKIEVLATLTDDFKLKIAVKDNGLGIATENIGQLFNSFSALETSARINPNGTGLGLHISNLLAKQLGDSPIRVVSALNIGSCFSFRVNILEEVQTTAMSFSHTTYDFDDFNTIQTVYSSKLKAKEKLPPILVVDDAPFNRIVLTEILKHAGFDCAEAGSGFEAVDYIVSRAKEGQPVKLVIMDYEMPVMDGPTACRAILKKLNELNLEVPKVIAHTAHSSEDVLKTCQDAGMVEFLPKPSPRDTLVGVVEKHLT
mmetsp:Transcript_9286/g.17774  ORF Transcript_9286/g.17774 Transcript_9286/m.17774 type:complete len:696 (-) Transcript_9286:23-2110(-)